jgi:hypothetical protein
VGETKGERGSEQNMRKTKKKKTARRHSRNDVERGRNKNSLLGPLVKQAFTVRAYNRKREPVPERNGREKK